MSDSAPIVPPVPAAGLYPLQIARNGAVCDGPAARALADYLHALAGRRLKLIGSFSQRATDCADQATLTTIWRALYHSSPNCDQCLLHAVLAPVHDTVATALDPALILTSKVADVSTNPATLSGTATEVTLRYDVRDEGTINPDDLLYASRTFNLSPDTTYALELATSDRARCVSASIYEVQRSSLSGTDAFVDTSSLGRGRLIDDATAEDMQTTAQTIYKRGGRQLFRWSDTNNGAGVGFTGATYVNLLDQTSVGWASDHPGFWTYPGDCGYLTSSTVDAVCYACAQLVSGTAEAGFYRDGVTIGKVEMSGSDAAYFVVAADLDSSNATEYVTVDVKADGDKGVKIYSVGMFEDYST